MSSATRPPRSTTIYPAATSGFFIKGGVGFSTFHESDGLTADGTDVGFLAGWDTTSALVGNISLTPVGNFYFGHVGDITSNNTTADTGWKQTVFDFGLGITFH